ncbi:hypothetical protein DL96DRAFT_1716946 [Flagelloscypha sp. PMI_526]|nr:hypothetical protein DL96DRAFT_1716946 [Flagelloscypha sp. PMI_526]
MSASQDILSNKAHVPTFWWLPHNTLPARAPSSNDCRPLLTFSRYQLPGIGLKLSDECVSMTEKETCMETGFWFGIELASQPFTYYSHELFFSDGHLRTLLRYFVQAKTMAGSSLSSTSHFHTSDSANNYLTSIPRTNIPTT